MNMGEHIEGDAKSGKGERKVAETGWKNMNMGEHIEGDDKSGKGERKGAEKWRKREGQI